MATQNTGKYDGAKNKFNVPAESVKQNAERLQMSESEYISFLNDFVRSYSQNPLFAYQHTDLSDVPVTIDFSSAHPTSQGSYSPATRSARISPSRNTDMMMRTLIHELTHAGQDKAGLFTSDETLQRTELPPNSNIRADRTAKALSYGPGELAAFFAESMHPALAGGRDWRIGELINRNAAESAKFYSQVAQPTRPVTSHPQIAPPSLSPIEKLKQAIFYFTR